MAKDTVSPINSYRKLDDNSFGNIKVIDLPAHADGQIGLLIKEVDHTILFCADEVATLFGPNYMFGYKNFEIAKKSLGTISKIKFDILVCGHGPAVLEDASNKFQKFK